MVAEDGFSERYGDLLYGSYDCVDRIVLNAYYPLGYNPGGFRTWWRRLHGDDEQLDNAHLMRMAGRFARRVRASAAAHGIPVIDCKRGERKHQIAEEYLATHPVGCGVFLILVARAIAPVWEVTRSSRGVLCNLAKKRAFVNHLDFRSFWPVATVSGLAAGAGVEDEGVIDALFGGSGLGAEGRGQFCLGVALVAGEVDPDGPAVG